MSPYFLAVDIGASSGRHMLGHLEKGRLVLEEIYRFENGMKQTKEGLCWDIPALFQEIKTGIRRCGELGKIPVSMGIDTWAVDCFWMSRIRYWEIPLDTGTAVQKEWTRRFTA